MPEKPVVRKGLVSLHLRPAFGMNPKTKDLFFTGGIDLYLDFEGAPVTLYCMLTHDTVQQLIDAITHSKKLPSRKPIAIPTSKELEALVYTIDQEILDTVDSPKLDFINKSSQFGDYLKDTLNDLGIKLENPTDKSE